ncbi:hypothetical protein QBC47DRAFT_377080, partial [Echria macrotheca]
RRRELASKRQAIKMVAFCLIVDLFQISRSTSYLNIAKTQRTNHMVVFLLGFLFLNLLSNYSTGLQLGTIHYNMYTPHARGVRHHQPSEVPAAI